MKVVAFPHLRFLIMGICSFGLFEGRRMAAPAPANVSRRDKLVEHFVEDDTFDKIAGHKGLIEKPMNANDFLIAVVDTKAD